MLHLGPEGHRRLRLVSALSLLQYHTSCSLCNAPLYSHKKGKSWQCYSENSFDLTDPLKGFQVPSKGPWTTLEEPPRVLPTGPGQQLSAPWTGFCPSTNIHYIHSSALLWPSPCECTLCFPAPPQTPTHPSKPTANACCMLKAFLTPTGKVRAPPLRASTPFIPPPAVECTLWNRNISVCVFASSLIKPETCFSEVPGVFFLFFHIGMRCRL